MPYPKERLNLALRIIKEDIERRRTAEAKKIARTQYREGFNLRRPIAVQAEHVNIWRRDDSSDDDYVPNTTRKRGNGKSRNSDQKELENRAKGSGKKRKRAKSPEKDQRPKLPSTSKSHDTGKSKHAAAFVTLTFATGEGRSYLQEKVKEHRDTHFDIYKTRRDKEDDDAPSGWSATKAVLHDAQKSNVAHIQDYDSLVPSRNQEGLYDLRLLRSGTVRGQPVPKRRKKNSSGDDSGLDDVCKGTISDEVAATIHGSKEASASESRSDVSSEEAKLNTVESIPSMPKFGSESSYTDIAPLHPRPSAARTIRSSNGVSADDAILIDSSEDEATTKRSPASSRNYSSRTPPTSASPPSPNLHTYSAPTSTTSEIVTLKTSFAHPITFKSIYKKCTFHSDYRHPILGHGPVTAQYLIYSDQPSQLIELGGGHTDQPHCHPTDTVCVSCSLSYLQITRCATHTFTRFSQSSSPALQNGGLSYLSDLMTKLKPGDPKRNPNRLATTCSLCRVPASYRCTAAQHRDKSLRPCALPHESIHDARVRLLREAASRRPRSSTPRHPDIDVQPPLLGCGLVLCGECHDLVAGTCRGDLQGHRATVLATIRARKMDARADVEFVFKEGLVYKAFHIDRD